MPAIIHQQVVDRELDRASDRWADRTGRAIVNACKREAPVDEGALRASIEYAVRRSGPSTKTVSVGSPLPYAAYLMTGTGIHGPTGQPITPVTARALAFKWDGPGSAVRAKNKRGVVIVKSVKGMKANPFLARGLHEVFGTSSTFTARVAF